jgi:hypothetical protein
MWLELLSVRRGSYIASGAHLNNACLICSIEGTEQQVIPDCGSLGCFREYMRGDIPSNVIPFKNNITYTFIRI